MNCAVGITLDALRDELGLSVNDLALRTPYEGADLSVTLLGEVPAPAGHLQAMARAMADVIEYQSREPAGV